MGVATIAVPETTGGTAGAGGGGTATGAGGGGGVRTTGLGTGVTAGGAGGGRRRRRDWGGRDGKRNRDSEHVGEVIRARVDDIHDCRVGASRERSRLRRDHQLIGFGRNGLGAAIGRVHPDPGLVRAEVIGVLISAGFLERERADRRLTFRRR